MVGNTDESRCTASQNLPSVNNPELEAHRRPQRRWAVLTETNVRHYDCIRSPIGNGFNTEKS